MLKRDFREWCNCVYRLGFTWLRIFLILFCQWSFLVGPFLCLTQNTIFLFFLYNIFCPTWIVFCILPHGHCTGPSLWQLNLKKKKKTSRNRLHAYRPVVGIAGYLAGQFAVKLASGHNGLTVRYDAREISGVLWTLTECCVNAEWKECN